METWLDDLLDFAVLHQEQQEQNIQLWEVEVQQENVAPILEAQQDLEEEAPFHQQQLHAWLLDLRDLRVGIIPLYCGGPHFEQTHCNVVPQFDWWNFACPDAVRQFGSFPLLQYDT